MFVEWRIERTFALGSAVAVESIVSAGGTVDDSNKLCKGF